MPLLFSISYISWIFLSKFMLYNTFVLDQIFNDMMLIAWN